VAREIENDAFGPNIWLVDEMYRAYQENPKAVGESWQEFFEDYAPARPRPSDGAEGKRAEAAAVPTESRPAPAPASTPAAPDDATPLRGVAARIAENMEGSLEVPTATSIRTIPAKLLEENRRIINRYLATQQGGKVSFTHLIGYAVLKGLEARPGMKATYAEVDGKPHAQTWRQ
jgi:2-oxoglutarate decarboxylase